MYDKFWEHHLSSDMNILVNINSGQCHELGLRTIAIFHPLVARTVLLLMLQGDGKQQMLSEYTMTCLNHHFLAYKGTHASQKLLERMGDMLKHRERFHEGKMKFSPIIQEIIDKDSIERAAEVLKNGFDITQDAFVAQQIARVYIEAKSWESAIDYAKKATSLVENNSHLYDTYGQVFRWKLEDLYVHLKSRRKRLVDEEILKAVSLAYDALGIFRKVQEISRRINATPNVGGYMGAFRSVSD